LAAEKKLRSLLPSLHRLLRLFLQAQKRELDHIRQNYRKNSLARSPKGGLAAATAVVMTPAAAVADLEEEDEDEDEEDEEQVGAAGATKSSS
jgi:hypothetical protein